MLAKYSPFKRKAGRNSEIVDFIARAEQTPALIAPSPSTPKLPERSTAGDFSSVVKSPRTPRTPRSTTQCQSKSEKDSLSIMGVEYTNEGGLPLRPFLTAQGQELERARVQVTSY